MYVMPAMYLPFLMYAAWMGMVLRPFMQRIDDAFETAALDADEMQPDPDMHRPAQALLPAGGPMQ